MNDKPFVFPDLWPGLGREENNPMKIDASDAGLAAQVMFAAAWLNSRTSEMNAENTERQSHGHALAYGEAAFTRAQREAVTLALTGELPEWVTR